MFALYALTAVATFLICAFAGRLGPVLGVVDAPDGKRKLHARPTPLIGGLAVLVPVVCGLLFMALNSRFAPIYLTIAAATALVMVLGYMDDRRHIRAAFRLVLSSGIVVAALAIVPGLLIRHLTFGFVGDVPVLLSAGLGLPEYFAPIVLGTVGGAVFTVVCLVGLQNAVNMADGKNGLVIGMCLVWTLVLLAFAPSHLEPLLIVLALGLAVAFVFNVAGRLFLGDAGTYGLSMLIGLLTLYVYNVNFSAFPADAVALMFLVPVLDTLRLIVSRALKGRSPFSSDRDHLHHILLSVMPWHWALTVYLSLVAFPIVLARFYVEWTGAIAVGSAVVYALMIALKYRPVLPAESGTLRG